MLLAQCTLATSENEVILKIMWSYDQSYDWEEKMSSIYGYKHENFLNCTCFYHYVKKVNMVMFNIKYHIKSGNQIDTYIKGALGYLGIINMMFLQIKRVAETLSWSTKVILCSIQLIALYGGYGLSWYTSKTHDKLSTLFLCFLFLLVILMPEVVG